MPAMPLISIACDDGSVKIVSLNFEPIPERVDTEIAKIFSNPGYTERPVSWRFISEADLPEKLGDREFRAAWRDDGKAIAHDMAHAREIRLATLRNERAGKLSKLDTEWMKAASQKGDVEAVEVKQQELRGFPVAIAPVLEAAETIEALKAIQLPE